MFLDVKKAGNRYSPGKTYQRLSIFFDFVGKGVSPASVGYVKFRLIVAGREYGPYRTTITTTKANWDSRKRLTVPVRGQLVQDQILTMQSRLLDGWAKLDFFGEEPITGDMILLASGIKTREAVEGFVYVH